MSTTTPRLRKGEATRRLILERAAPVFNQRGYAGASMSELVEATGIEKGGIYNHFGSKEDLAVEAFDYLALCPQPPQRWQFLPHALARWYPSRRSPTGSNTNEPAATINGFAGTPFTRTVFPGSGPCRC